MMQIKYGAHIFVRTARIGGEVWGYEMIEGRKVFGYLRANPNSGDVFKFYPVGVQKG